MSIQKFCYLQEVLDQSTTHRKGCLCSPKAILTNREEMPNNSAETETNFSEYPFCNDFTESSLDPAFHVGFGNWFYCPQMYHFPDSVLLGIWKVFQWKKKKKNLSGSDYSSSFFVSQTLWESDSNSGDFHQKNWSMQIYTEFCIPFLWVHEHLKPIYGSCKVPLLLI